MKTLFKSICFLLIVLCVACKKEIDTFTQTSEQKIVEQLSCMGFNTQDVLILDNYAVMEKDICVDIDALHKTMPKGNNLLKNTAKTDAWAIDAGASVMLSTYEIFIITYNQAWLICKREMNG